MTKPASDIDAMFHPQLFRDSGHELIDLLTEHLSGNLAGQGKVLEWLPPAQAANGWHKPMPRQPELTSQELMKKLARDILPGSLHIHHPRNMGHQVATPLPMAALCDLVAALTNQAMAVYETGPTATMLEQQVLRWLAEAIGWTAADGVLTSGGAQANLTALLAARQRMAGWDVWQNGVAAGPPLRLFASAHAHYSVARAAGIMGLGAEAVVKIAADDMGRMQPAALREAHRCSQSRGERIVAVVATAGTTSTGSIDPLAEIGAYCRGQGLWLHVDGAHGASALLSDTHRDTLRGIELADSVVWDGHKLLYMPAPVSAVIFRNPQDSYAAFAQEASYLFQGDSSADEAFNTSYRTLECTKRMMGLKLWAAFMLYGADGLGTLVDKVFSAARQFADKLDSAPDFELLLPPQTNIVCFRHRPQNLAPTMLDQHQVEIRLRLVASGAFHLTQTQYRGALWLRTTIMNPYTSDDDFNALLFAIRVKPG